MSEARDIVLAVDPGGTTGWAAWSPTERLTAGQSEFGAFVRMVNSWQEFGWISEIVCERYVITPRTAKLSQQTTALEVIGYLRAISEIHGVKFTLQTPADAKKFGTNDRLTTLGWIQRPLADHDHANDAIRHLVTYLFKTKRLTTADLRA